MREVLLIDCCIRRESSRTRRLAQAFVDALDPARFHVTVLDPEAEGLRPLTGAFFQAREELLARRELDHPRFRYARQLAQADLVVFAAPFWDLSFPAMLKIYIENVCVEGITFTCDEEGLRGSCKASHMVFLTTRGGETIPVGERNFLLTQYKTDVREQDHGRYCFRLDSIIDPAEVAAVTLFGQTVSLG